MTIPQRDDASGRFVPTRRYRVRRHDSVWAIEDRKTDEVICYSRSRKGARGWATSFEADVISAEPQEPTLPNPPCARCGTTGDGWLYCTSCHVELGAVYVEDDETPMTPEQRRKVGRVTALVVLGLFFVVFIIALFW